MQEIKMTVHPFRMGADKEAAVKVLEEAAEVFGAWQCLDDALMPDEDGYEFPEEMIDGEREMLADELADVIQAACNLSDRYGIDLGAALERVEAKNRERGRYE
jgi:NTP pyrophosphatase (non-canonical NTP hydrolase)